MYVTNVMCDYLAIIVKLVSNRNIYNYVVSI